MECLECGEEDKYHDDLCFDCYYQIHRQYCGGCGWDFLEEEGEECDMCWTILCGECGETIDGQLVCISCARDLEEDAEQDSSA